MTTRRLIAPLADQRGIALPMAMMALILLSALVVAFAVLSTSEPTIANNQLMANQARAVAEAGMERAIWALNNPADPNGIPNPMAAAPAPYDGSQLVMVASNGTNIGGFRVTVTNAVALNERNIVADGWVPNDTATPRGKQRITVTVETIRFPDPPAGLLVLGEVQVGGNASVDSRNDTSCGNKLGVIASDNVNISGSGSIYGADGNNTRNQATDYLQSQPQAGLLQYTFTDAELAALKSLAQSRGTYYQGAVTFNAANRMPNGIIFVDTTTGNPIDGSTPISEFAQVDIHGNAPADPSGIFSGWLIVNGSIWISGNFRMHGLAYAQNNLTYMGTGTGQIRGAVISRNIRDTSSTNIDTPVTGNSLIEYNCSDARTGGGQVPMGWNIKAGTYREVSG
jgi:hypothetical protein